MVVTRRHGISPVIGTTILVLIAIGLAAGASVFVQTQQEAISDTLAEAFGERLAVEQLICNGDEVRYFLVNEGDDPLETGRADFRVLQGGRADFSFTQEDVLVDGAFQNVGGSSWLNVTMGATFVSGLEYTIDMIFVGSDLTVTRNCRAGLPWWDISWDHRRQIQVMKLSGPDTQVASIQLNTTAIADEGKMLPGCEDVRVVEGDTVVPYAVSDCNDDRSINATITFNSTVSGEEDFDTYLYYGNFRASGNEEDPGSLDAGFSTLLQGEEER